MEIHIWGFSGYVFPNALILVGFPYDEVYESWMGVEEV